MFPIELSYMPLFLIPFYCPHASSIPRSFQTKIFPYLFWFLLGWKVEVNNERWKNKTKTKKQKNKIKIHSFLSLPISFLCAVTTIAIGSSIQSSPPHHYHSHHFLLPPPLLSPPRPLPSSCLHEALSVQVS